MSWKYSALLLVGLILGAGAGYGVSLVYTPEVLDEFLPNNYKSRSDRLQQQLENLTGLYEATISDRFDIATATFKGATAPFLFAGNPLGY